MRVALQALPAAVTRHTGHAGDVPAHFKQAADTFVAQVMEVQILNAQDFARTRE